MTTDLTMLAWSAALCAVLWLPYVMARITAWGLIEAVGYPQSPPAVPEWSTRTAKAHANLVENLVPFAALVLVAHLGGMANDETAIGATIFFWGRVVHVIAYIFAIPWVRTLGFFAGFVGMTMVFLEIVAP